MYVSMRWQIHPPPFWTHDKGREYKEPEKTSQVTTPHQSRTLASSHIIKLLYLSEVVTDRQAAFFSVMMQWAIMSLCCNDPQGQSCNRNVLNQSNKGGIQNLICQRMHCADLLKLVAAAWCSWCKGEKGWEEADWISAETRGEVFCAFFNPANGP